MKDKRQRGLFIALDILVILALAGTVTHVVLTRKQRDSATASSCTQPAENHKLTLQHNQFSRIKLMVALCDTITITNNDDQAYMLNFGDYDKHQDYPGFTPQVQVKGESIAFNALQIGTYQLHDHITNQAHLELTVTAK